VLTAVWHVCAAARLQYAVAALWRTSSTADAHLLRSLCCASLIACASPAMHPQPCMRIPAPAAHRHACASPRLQLTAMRCVAAGEELCISYVGDVSLYKPQELRTTLAEYGIPV
jgi:hypothetical protein